MTTIRERAENVEAFTEQRVRSLQNGYRGNHSTEVAELARLRRGVGKRIDADLELMGLALTGPDVDLIDSFAARSDEPTPEEHAVFAAVTLYAVHQQSKRTASMHHRGYSLGRSARLLAREAQRDSVRARFTALGTATTWDETVHHARGLIQQFRQYDIALDYGRFSRDLFDIHVGDADRVRLAWGRDFYRVHHAEDDARPEGDSPPHDDTPATAEA